MHVVWSRIDPEHCRAVHLAFDHDKLMRVTRAFARDHGIPLPKGYEKSRQVGQVSLHEQVQKQETGLSKADHMRAVTDAWQRSDDARAFMRDERADQRIRDRGGEDVMPSLEHLVAVAEPVEVRREADLIAAFGKAKSKGPEGSPDLLGAFSSAMISISGTSAARPVLPEGPRMDGCPARRLPIQARSCSGCAARGG